VYQARDFMRWNRINLPLVRKAYAGFNHDDHGDYFACALGATADQHQSCAWVVAASMDLALASAFLKDNGDVDPSYKAFFAHGTCHDFVDDSDPSCSYDSTSAFGTPLNDWTRGWGEVPGFDWPMAAKPVQ
jgi:hypothetical protein